MSVGLFGTLVYMECCFARTVQSFHLSWACMEERWQLLVLLPALSLDFICGMSPFSYDSLCTESFVIDIRWFGYALSLLPVGTWRTAFFPTVPHCVVMYAWPPSILSQSGRLYLFPAFIPSWRMSDILLCCATRVHMGFCDAPLHVTLWLDILLQFV